MAFNFTDADEKETQVEILETNTGIELCVFFVSESTDVSTVCIFILTSHKEFGLWSG